MIYVRVASLLGTRSFRFLRCATAMNIQHGQREFVYACAQVVN